MVHDWDCCWDGTAGHTFVPWRNRNTFVPFKDLSPVGTGAVPAIPSHSSKNSTLETGAGPRNEHPVFVSIIPSSFRLDHIGTAISNGICTVLLDLSHREGGAVLTFLPLPSSSSLGGRSMATREESGGARMEGGAA